MIVALRLWGHPQRILCGLTWPYSLKLLLHCMILLCDTPRASTTSSISQPAWSRASARNFISWLMRQKTMAKTGVFEAVWTLTRQVCFFIFFFFLCGHFLIWTSFLETAVSQMVWQASEPAILITETWSCAIMCGWIAQLCTFGQRPCDKIDSLPTSLSSFPCLDPS